MQHENQPSEPLAAELRALFERAKLPTDPTLASQILALTNDPASTADDFGDLIRADPALATRTLGAANSVYYAQSTPVTTIERAVTVLGLNQIKTAALGFQLIAHLDRLGGTPFDMKAFWQRSLVRACYAKALARTIVKELEQEAFLVGLLQEIGVVLLVQLFGSSYAELYGASLSPTAFYTVEQGAFPHTHADAVAVMGREWKLPELIVRPLENHHRRPTLGDDPQREDLLWAVSYLVGGVRLGADLSVDPNEDEVRQFAVTSLGLNEEGLTQIQQNAAAEYHAVSAVFCDVLPENVDIADLLNEANRQLTSTALAAGQRVLDVEKARSQILEEQTQLRQALSEYRERAALDPLTHVLNRGAIADALLEVSRANLAEGTPVGVLFIDLDDFKKLNDAHGHQVGDNVLKAVAATLAGHSWADAAVGRYGGEEFVVMLGGVSADACRTAGECVVNLVRGICTAELGCDGGLTCSVGSVWADDFRRYSPDQVVAFADELMYRAKRGGKNQSCFGLMPATPSSIEPSHDRPLSTPCTAVAAMADHQSHGEIQIEALMRLSRQLNANDADDCAEMRRRERSKIVAPCVCSYFASDGATMEKCQSATRNLSTGGVSLLIPLPLARGEPIEIFLPRPGADLYLAGLVAFGRHVAGGVHEIGVQLMTHSRKPILSADPAAALEQHDWVTQALAAKPKTSVKQAVAALA